MRRYIPLVALVLVVLLGGCGPMTQAGIDTALGAGEAGIKAAHDREALIAKQAPCAMSVGGYNRVLTLAEKDAVAVLCGGSPSVTVEDLVGLNKALRQIAPVSPATPD